MRTRNYTRKLFSVLTVLAVLIPATLLGLVPIAQAISLSWTQTSPGDFQVGTATQVDVNASPGDVLFDVSSTMILDQQQTNNSGSDTVYSGNYSAQTFQPSISGLLTRVTLRVSKNNNPTGALVVQLRNTTSDAPTGGALATAQLPASSISTSATNTNFDFNIPYNVTAGTRYALVMYQGTPGGSSSNSYNVYRQSTGNPYSNGRYLTSNNSGSSWSSPGSNYDMYFQTYIGSYYTSGNLESSTSGNLGNVISWGTIVWTANSPTGTSVQFQLATSNNAGGPWTYVGPNGTNATYYTTSGSNITNLPINSYIRYRAYLAGNGTNTPVLQDITITYNVPPAVPTLSSPANGSTTNNQRPQFAWSAVTGATSYNIHIDDNSDFSSPVIDQSSITILNFTPGSNLNPGVYYWRVRAYDGTYYSGWQTTAWSLNIDTNVPQSQTSSPAYTNANFTVSAININDPGLPSSGVAGVRLYYRISTGNWTQFGSEQTSGYSWTNFNAPAGQGIYYFQTVARDNAGNAEPVPSGNTGVGDSQTIYDTTAPGTPTISSSTHPEGVWRQSNDPFFSWTAPVPTDLSGVVYYYVVDQSSGTTPQSTNPVTTSNTLSLIDQADGQWYLHVRARDNAGNWGTTTDQYNFRIDTGAPSSRANAPAGPINTLTFAVPFTATDALDGIATNGVTLTYRYNGGTWTPYDTASGTSGDFNFTL